MKQSTLLHCVRHEGVKSYILEIASKKRFIGIALLSFIFEGCMDIHTTMGRRPDVTVLETKLLMGQSTRQDVLDALGEPYGNGSEMLPLRNAPRPTWSYYYGEGNLKDARGMFLFVFFDNDRYDGYMWFSSLAK